METANCLERPLGWAIRDERRTLAQAIVDTMRESLAFLTEEEDLFKIARRSVLRDRQVSTNPFKGPVAHQPPST